MRGHVRKHGSGWAVVIDLGRHVPCQVCQACGRRVWLGRKPLPACPECGGSLFDSEGRRQEWHRGFATRREAERARTDLLGRLDAGAYVPPTKQTLTRFLLDEWLPAKETTLKPSTLSPYRMYVRAYITGSRIGSVPLARVDGPRLTAFYADLLAHGRRQAEGGLSAKMVRNVHGMLHKALADAVRWGRVVRNAADAADQPRKSSPEMQVWTPEEMRTFLEHVRDDRLFAAWQILATTGMRRGELLGLRWADIDVERGSLTIRQVRTAVDYTVETGTPKTHKGTRTVSLDPATLAGLRAHRRQQNEDRLIWGGAWMETGLVFVRSDGSAIHPQRLSQWFAQHVRRAGLPRIRLHDVRHSYATAVIRAGVPLKVVSQRIGHANPTITMTTYQHVLPGDDEQAALIGARAILGTP